MLSKAARSKSNRVASRFSLAPRGAEKRLLDIIAGFDSLSIGEVRLGNEVIASHDGVLQSGPDRMVVFQHGGLFPWMTVIENVCYGPIIQRSMAPPQARDVARRMLSRVGLTEISETILATFRLVCGVVWRSSVLSSVARKFC